MSEPLKLLENDHQADELRARLEAARAKRQAIDDARARRDEQESLRNQVEEEERKLSSAQAVADAEEKHGRVGVGIAVVPTDHHGVIIVKKPNHVLYRKWRDGDDPTTTSKMEEFVTPAVVYPDRGAFAAIIQDQPALLDVLCTQVAALAGFKLKGAAGKS